MDIKIEPEYIEVDTSYSYENNVDNDMKYNIKLNSMEGITDNNSANVAITSMIKLKREVNEFSDYSSINIKQDEIDVKEETLSSNANEIVGTKLVILTESNQKGACDEESEETNKTKCFRCNICSSVFSEIFCLNRHLLMHSNKKEFHCTICGYKCNDKSRFVIHSRMHTGERPYNCNFCNYKASQRSHLVYHIKIHTEENPLSCTLCNYKCRRQASLINHLRKTHTGERPFSCNVCDYTCTSKNCLTSHLTNHSKEKRFCCNICNYGSSRKSDLTSHLRIHTGEKPFSCTMCDYRCRVRYQLTYHQRHHTDEKIVSHQRTRTGEKPYGCNLGQLNKHLKSHKTATYVIKESDHDELVTESEVKSELLELPEDINSS